MTSNRSIERTFQKFQRLLAPPGPQLLGGVNTPAKAIVVNHVTAFGPDGSASSPRPFTAPIAATTLYTSAADFARFLVVLLNDAPILKQTTEAPVSADTGLELGWGLGWGIEEGEDDLFIWHWGSNPGYRSFVVASVRTGNGFVMLTDSDSGLRLAGPIAALVVPAAHRMFRFRMLNSLQDVRAMFVGRLRARDTRR